MQVVAVTEQPALFESGFLVLETKRKVQEAIHPMLSFRNDDLRELVDEHELTIERFLPDSVNLVFNDVPYTVRGDDLDASSRYDALVLEGTKDAVAFCKWVLSLELTNICFSLSCSFASSTGCSQDTEEE